MHEARAGDQMVVGYEGMRVEPLERPRQREAFSFMQSAVSSERAKALAIADVADAMRVARERGGRTCWCWVRRWCTQRRVNMWRS